MYAGIVLICIYTRANVTLKIISWKTEQVITTIRTNCCIIFLGFPAQTIESVRRKIFSLFSINKLILHRPVKILIIFLLKDKNKKSITVIFISFKVL